MEQWQFMVALNAIEGKASLDLLNIISPISPSLMVDFLNRASSLELIEEGEPGFYTVPDTISKSIQKKIISLSTKANYSMMLDHLAKSDASDSIDSEIKANLLLLAGREEEGILIKYTIGFQSVKKGLLSKAFINFQDFIDYFSEKLGKLASPEYESMFVSTALELSHLRFCIGGKQLHETPKLLKKAEKIANRKGDRRSLALIKMHMGRYVFNRDRLNKALNILESGIKEAKELGDEDIMSSASEFQGAYYYYQGMFKNAIDYYEKALQKSELHENKLIAFFLPHWMGLCAAYLGRFRQSIGILDCYSRRARDKNELALADNFKSTLAVVFLMAGRLPEASSLIDEALKTTQKMKNHLGIYLVRIALAYYNYLKKRPKKAYSLFRKAITDSDSAGVSLRQYSYPWFLEMLYEFHKLNYEPIPGFEYVSERDRALQSCNIHLRGVAWRLKAKELILEGENVSKIKDCLKKSEEALIKSGNPLELAKTWIEIARVKLFENDQNTARQLVLNAWESFSGLNQELFPEDLIPLIEGNDLQQKSHHPEQVSVDQFIDIINRFAPIDNIEDHLHQMLIATSKFFATERGGIFWSSDNYKKNGLQLKVGYNLTQNEVMHESFRNNLSCILKAFKKNKPVCISYGKEQKKIKRNQVLYILCIPFMIGGKTQGVLYYDNSFHRSTYKPFPDDQITIMSHHLGICIEQLSEYYGLDGTPPHKAVVSVLSSDQSITDEIKTTSKKMLGILKIADKVANSDANVLILGETGVGKELLVKRIHKMSPKSSGPFHTVDVNNIPENLIESELFGHEKGAFTGADRRKIGRLELVNHGTLFIDEVGNIPLTTQAKLLRTLQEKSFVRVGGTKTIKSDFRLLAATNANLEQQVINGSFREDLFYRLNVVPIIIPPLRERNKDIVYLAKHFLKIYIKRHNRSVSSISKQDESMLCKYHWPGNIRELRNLMERAVLLSTEGELSLNLPLEKQVECKEYFDDLPTMKELQRRYISYVTKRTGGRISGPYGAAKILGMNRTTLYSRMEKLGLKTKNIKI